MRKEEIYIKPLIHISSWGFGSIFERVEIINYFTIICFLSKIIYLIFSLSMHRIAKKYYKKLLLILIKYFITQNFNNN